MKEYVVLELAQTQEGKLEPAIYSYEDVVDARALFYNKCAVAVKSAYRVHTVVLMNVSGAILEGPKCFRHEPAATPVDDGGEEVTPE